MIEIAGGAGIGKSRLMEEVIARSPDVTVLHARCEEYEASTPYFAFRGLMRTVLRLAHDADGDEVERRLGEIVERVDPDLVPWIPLLGILLGLDLADTPETAALDERFLRERLGEVTMQFLFTMLAGTPTMIAVEDVHFMDEASRDLLLRLARANTELRHVILVTNGDLRSLWAPTDEDDDPHARRLPAPASRVAHDRHRRAGHGGRPARASRCRRDRAARGRQHVVPLRAARGGSQDRDASRRCRTRSSR